MRRRATEKCPSSFQFVRSFADLQSTFMTADELLHKFDFFPKFRRANWSRTATAACHYLSDVLSASKINFIQQPVYASPGPIFPGKHSQHTLSAPVLLLTLNINQRAIVFADLSYTEQNHYKFVTYYGYCNSQMAPLCLPPCMFAKCKHMARHAINVSSTFFLKRLQMTRK